MKRFSPLLLASVVGVAACSDRTGPTEADIMALEAASLSVSAIPTGELRYVVAMRGNELPANLAKRISDAGGILEGEMPGVVIARSSDPTFMAKASRIAGVRTVFPDLPVHFSDADFFESAPAHVGYPPNSTATDPFFNLQWGHTAIDAPGAWAVGARGQGATVFVLDNGIRSNHPDLEPNLNKALSRSFVVAYNSDGVATGIEPYDSPPGSHGSHVAGTIAAADNHMGVIGVAPAAQIVAVKVLSAGTNPSFSSYTMQGLYYAADNGADVVNLSLGTVQRFRHSGFWITVNEQPLWYRAQWVAEFQNEFKRATNYAQQKGVTIVAAAGNNAINRLKNRDGVEFPSDLPGVITVSGTGPNGWGLDQTVDLNGQSYYTDYGRGTIDFAAPGGDLADNLFQGPAFGPGGVPLWPTCTVAGIFEFCVHFDRVFSTTATGWGWSNGTSMAAPHVSGVAALVIGQNGGRMNPSHVMARLRAGAVDLGKRGRDDLYGHGLINAARSVGAAQ